MTRFRHYMNALVLMLIACFLASTAYAAAQMWCLKDTKQCAYGTPSGFTTAEKTQVFDKMTVAGYAQAVLDGVFQAVTPNYLKAKGKELLTPATCPSGQTGTPPNCVTPPPPKPVCSEFQTYNAATNKCDAIPCDAGFTGWKPVCTPVVAPPVTDLMPFVDKTKNIVPKVGHSDLRIKTTGKQPYSGDIAVRVFCGVSHMNNDDPLVFPNQKDATHHHTYFGNTSVKYDSDLNNLANVGNSTCWGGIMNRSAYWHPTMIDSAGKPMISDSGDGNGQGVLFYYKAGYDGVRHQDIKPVPNGLRILTGNPKATTSAQMKNVNWHCHVPSTGNGHSWNSSSIPNCNVGEYVVMAMDFPRCWDGKNLDSPNHNDHMSRAVSGGCPASHPVPLPQITFNMRFKVTKPGEALTWRLSSDNYAYNGKNAGYSAHADYVAAWNPDFMALLVKNCLNAGRDCGGDVIGDGRVFYN
jgi:hypothetical protein